MLRRMVRGRSNSLDAARELEAGMGQAGEGVVRWRNSEAEARVCPVCGDGGQKVFVLQVRTPFPHSEWLDLYRCPACRSAFYHPIVVPQYEEDYGFKNYIKFYVEQRAGIDFMIAPLVRVAQAGPFRSLLEVGCGFGFAVDFASQVLGWEAVGVEPSRYGKAGAELLGVKIYHDYVQNVSELRGRKFDVVFSTEVIEHIADFKGFLELLKTYLSEIGVLVLTTPNAEWIRENTQWSTLLEILYPGFHLVLFTPRGLETTLRDVGFRDVRIEERNHRLVAYASLQGLSRDKEADPEATRHAYIQYLETLMDKKGQRQDGLYDGTAYRLFKERVNQGEYDKALAIFETLKSSLVSKYGASVLEPEATCAIAEAVSSFDELGERLPYNLAGVYYYLGMLNLNSTKDYDYASRLFRGGFRLSIRLLTITTGNYPEGADLLWRMKYHEGLAYLYQEKRNEALQEFQFILSHRGSSERFHFITPPQEVILGSLYHSGIAELQLGNLTRAVQWFLTTLDEERPSGDFHLARETVRHMSIAVGLMMAQLEQGSSRTAVKLRHRLLRRWRGVLRRLFHR